MTLRQIACLSGYKCSSRVECVNCSGIYTIYNGVARVAHEQSILINDFLNSFQNFLQSSQEAKTPRHRFSNTVPMMMNRFLGLSRQSNIIFAVIFVAVLVRKTKNFYLYSRIFRTTGIIKFLVLPTMSLVSFIRYGNIKMHLPSNN